MDIEAFIYPQCGHGFLNVGEEVRGGAQLGRARERAGSAWRVHCQMQRLRQGVGMALVAGRGRWHGC